MTASSRRGLAQRIFAGLLVALTVGAGTTAVVAAVVGPRMFHAHLLQAGGPRAAGELAHIERAYRDASVLALSIGILLSLITATAVAWFLARRLRRPLDEITRAATEFGRGHHEVRVGAIDSGTELDTLAHAFDAMATRIQGVEDGRRRMLSDLAHELRTPITTLTAYHDGLHDGVVTLGPESAAVLAEQTERIARLAADIEQVSSAEEGRLDLEIRLRSVADLLCVAQDGLRDRFAARGITLTVEPPDPVDLQVPVDRQRIGQVLTNLLTNALRHSSPGGVVTISSRTEAGEVLITVSDDGDGMTPEQLAHAFERFYRGDSARTHDRLGSGIGLTISRAIAEAHGGRLDAASDGLGRGSAFTIRLAGATAADASGRPPSGAQPV